MKKILITGAAGFLGYPLSACLAQEGHTLTLVDNFSRGKNDASFESLCRKKNVTFLPMDLTHPESFQSLRGPFDHVYHLAAINGTRFFYEKPDEVLKVNLLTTLHLLDWFVASDSKKLLFASSSEVYAGTVLQKEAPLPTPETVSLSIPDIFNPRFSYAASKMTGELLIIHTARRYGFPFHIVRYHNIYGPRMGMDHVIPQLIQRAMKKENPFPIYGAAHQRCFCYISDACEATRQLMERSRLEEEVLHIGNPKEEIEILVLAKKICRLAHWQPEFQSLPAPPGSVCRRVPDTTQMEKAISFRPKINLTSGLQQTYQWYASQR